MTDAPLRRVIAARELKRDGVAAILAFGEPTPSGAGFACLVTFSLESGDVLWTIQATGIDAVDAIRGALVMAEARLLAEGEGVVTFLDDTDLHLRPRV